MLQTSLVLHFHLASCEMNVDANNTLIMDRSKSEVTRRLYIVLYQQIDPKPCSNNFEPTIWKWEIQHLTSLFLRIHTGMSKTWSEYGIRDLVGIFLTIGLLFLRSFSEGVLLQRCHKLGDASHVNFRKNIFWVFLQCRLEGVKNF